MLLILKYPGVIAPSLALAFASTVINRQDFGEIYPGLSLDPLRVEGSSPGPRIAGF